MRTPPASLLLLLGSTWTILLAGCAPEEELDSVDSVEQEAIGLVEEVAGDAQEAGSLPSRGPIPKLQAVLGPRAAAPPSSDSSAPTDGSITIAGGATWTRTSSVTLSLSASDDVGVTEMCISKTSTCSAWTTYSTTKAYSLGTSQGSITLNVWFRDAAGNVSPKASDSISLDSVKPTDGTATASASAGQVDLSWTGFQDGGSGIASYTVVYGLVSAPANCTTGTVAYTGTDTTAGVTGLTDGITHYFRICTTDEAGNVSTVRPESAATKWSMLSPPLHRQAVRRALRSTAAV